MRSDDDLVQVYESGDPLAAELIRGILESTGMPVVLLSNPKAGHRILCRALDAPDAREAIHQLEHQLANGSHDWLPPSLDDATPEEP